LICRLVAASFFLLKLITDMAQTVQFEPACADSIKLKEALEDALSHAPNDTALRKQYFSHLAKLAESSIGLFQARLPEIPTPIYFRGGTSDIVNMQQIFQDGKLNIPLRRVPQRILDLGGYAGYAAVFLATHFPTAHIMTVEPMTANFRLLALNTLPYRRILPLNAAVGRQSGRLRILGTHDADWGFMLAETQENGPGTVISYSVPDLLQLRGWDRVDLIKCDIEGFEATLFADVSASWIRALDTLVIETHDHMMPGCSAVVAACFSETEYAHRMRGECHIYERRLDANPPNEELEPLSHPLPPIVLVHSGPDCIPLRLENVVFGRDGFFLFEDIGLQLLPNPPGSAPAQAVFSVFGQGQTRFSATIAHAGVVSEDIVFRVLVRRLADGALLLDSARRVLPGARGEWHERLPRMDGMHEVVLQTEMAPGAQSNHAAYARWLEPRFY
jgi:FkbM family methyltransferase